ncbi:DUF2752 domain-containing protein [Mucilaginibacter daejeonensis]|uniref:DUF2752 domain-containing protein n=1 Tax=Mucilaginibacter daejeonensis TaxID=398049 RepID=UPI001D179B56|nr:DUF2752 domain-containing protein [Mucilaginibacter daejeonensis]UEG53025.1 DUF2752 domain-containing protein [Mucilaginibacter daejeonensis]
MIDLLKKNIELIFWTAAILALAAADPSAQPHYTICVFKLAGINWCPGCGLGHSISWLLHGDIAASLKAHWLGIPALAIIFWRTGQLLKRMAIFKASQNYEPS